MKAVMQILKKINFNDKLRIMGKNFGKFRRE